MSHSARITRMRRSSSAINAYYRVCRAEGGRARPRIGARRAALMGRAARGQRPHWPLLALD